MHNLWKPPNLATMATTWVPTDTFAVRLRILRFQLGMSVEEIATQCGIQPTTWTKWERGTQPRSMDKVVRDIVGSTDVDRDWLMWGGPLIRSRCFSQAWTPESELAYAG